MNRIFPFLFLLILQPLLLSAQGPSRSGSPAPSEGISFLRQFPCAGTTIADFGFEAGIPAGWQILDYDSLQPKSYIDTFVNAGWQLIQDFKDSSNHAVASPSWYETPGKSEDWLITDQISLGANSCLSWYAYSQDRYFPESYEVRISTTTADTAAFFVEDALLEVESESYFLNYRSVNLAAYAGQYVYLAFRHTSFDKFILVLDNIRLGEVDVMDIGAFELKALTPDTMDEVKIRAAVINFGSDTLVADSILRVSYSIDGGTPKTMILRDSIVLSPNDTLQFVHDSIWTPVDNRAYKLCIWTSGVPDDNPLNDSICVWVGVGTATSIHDVLPSGSIKAYPNPAGEFLYVERTDLSANARLSVSMMNLVGQTIISDLHFLPGENRVEIRTGELPAGLYLLRVRDELGRETVKKVVVE